MSDGHFLVLNRFELLEPIGAGGQGVLHEGRDTHTGAIVAIKLQRPRTFESTQMHLEMGEEITDESTTLRRMSEIEGIPRLIDHGIYQGEYGTRACYVMEFVDGTCLLDVMGESRPASLASAAAVIGRLSEILIRVHDIGWVHRDVKPENVMLEPDGTVRLLDLGLAGPFHEWFTPPRGTVGYAPPEQFKDGYLTPRVDVFALGCLFLEMTVMRLPYAGLMARPGPDRPVLPADRLRLVPQEIRSLVLSMVELEPRNRPRDTREVLDALRPVLPRQGDPAPTRSMRPDPTFPYRTGRTTPA